MRFQSFKGRSVQAGGDYEAYKNLHNGLISLRCAVTGLVVGHVDQVRLTGVSFKVSQAGRERVLRDKKKNVHAVVRGTISPVQGEGFDRPLRVAYNPYKFSQFMLTAGSDVLPLAAAARAVVSASDGVTVDSEGRVLLMAI